MIVKQEGTSPIQNAADKLHLQKAFESIVSMAGDRIVDTELLKEYCSTVNDLLKTFISNINSIEKEETKKSNKDKIKEHLFGHDPYGD